MDLSQRSPSAQAQPDPGRTTIQQERTVGDLGRDTIQQERTVDYQGQGPIQQDVPSAGAACFTYSGLLPDDETGDSVQDLRLNVNHGNSSSPQVLTSARGTMPESALAIKTEVSVSQSPVHTNSIKTVKPEIDPSCSVLQEGEEPIPCQNYVLLFQKLAMILDNESGVDSKDWRGLADALGFPGPHIRWIKSREKTWGSNTRCLLEDYCWHPRNSMQDVLAALQKLGCLGAANIILEEIPELRHRQAYRSVEQNTEAGSVLSTEVVQDKTVTSSEEKAKVYKQRLMHPAPLQGPPSHAYAPKTTKSHSNANQFPAVAHSQEHQSLSSMNSLYPNMVSLQDMAGLNRQLEEGDNPDDITDSIPADVVDQRFGSMDRFASFNNSANFRCNFSYGPTVSAAMDVDEEHLYLVGTDRVDGDIDVDMVDMSVQLSPSQSDFKKRPHQALQTQTSMDDTGDMRGPELRRPRIVSSTDYNSHGMPTVNGHVAVPYVPPTGPRNGPVSPSPAAPFPTVSPSQQQIIVRAQVQQQTAPQQQPQLQGKPAPRQPPPLLLLQACPPGSVIPVMGRTVPQKRYQAILPRPEPVQTPPNGPHQPSRANGNLVQHPNMVRMNGDMSQANHGHVRPPQPSPVRQSAPGQAHGQCVAVQLGQPKSHLRAPVPRPVQAQSQKFYDSQGQNENKSIRREQQGQKTKTERNEKTTSWPSTSSGESQSSPKNISEWPNSSQKMKRVLSQSVPKNMKLTDSTRNAKSRVFITYSEDSRDHMHRVMDLSKCLRQNGFSVSMDQYDKLITAQDKFNWVDARFNQVDFIVVCISPKYIKDCEEKKPDTPASDHSMHTQYIYNRMKTEYVNNYCKNYRFIPLIFPEASWDHVPAWLQNTTVYHWPSQWQDVLFMLMKPDELIHSMNQSSQKSSQTAEAPVITTVGENSLGQKSPMILMQST